MGYTAGQHWIYTVIGLILLVVIVFTLRGETSFLAQSRDRRVQFVLSIISIFIMILLTLTLLFHWSLRHEVVITALVGLVPILLVLSPLILLLRYRTFKGEFRDRMEDRNRLIREVQDLIDQKKREDIKAGKIQRGEPVD